MVSLVCQKYEIISQDVGIPILFSPSYFNSLINSHSRFIRMDLRDIVCIYFHSIIHLRFKHAGLDTHLS